MKLTPVFVLSAFALCLVSSSVQAAAPAVYSAAQPTFSFADSFRSFFSDPNIAYLLLSMAILGLLIEIINPGIYMPGIFGIIAAVLASYALGLLSVNPLGLVLLILALPLFILGAYQASAFILFTAAGIAALVTGSLYLFHAGLRIHPALIAAVVIIMSAVFILISNRVIKSQRLRIAAGSETLLRRTAVVRTPLEPRGTVMVEGELWQAELDSGEARAGENVVITAIQGLKLIVTKKKGGE